VPMYASPLSIIYIAIACRTISQTKAHHSVAHCDGFGSSLDSWRGIGRAVWISRPTSDLALGQLCGSGVLMSS
jgi:hypothetical protein